MTKGNCPYDAADGGVSVAPNHHKSISKGKTNQNTGAVKGSKISHKVNSGKKRGKSGVADTEPMKMAGR